MALVYLLLFGGIVLVWLSSGTTPHAARVAVEPLWIISCIAPALAQVAVALFGRARKQQLVATCALVLFGPILLLMWASSVDVASGAEPAVEPGAFAVDRDHQLDLEATFRGAVARQQGAAGNAPTPTFAAAAFADGTELLVMRLADSTAARATFEFTIGARKGSAHQLGSRQGMKLDDQGPASVLFVYVELHGRDVLEARGRDEAAVRARLAQQAVPPPPSLAATAQSLLDRSAPNELPVWLFPAAYAFAHLLGFLAFLTWSAKATTRVAAAPVPPVSKDELAARILSLNESALPLSVARAADAGDLVIDYRFADDARRSHRAILRIDEAQRSARVRELAGAHGAAPVDAEEARMQPIGTIDPRRPSTARAIFARKLLATPITPEELAGVDVALSGRRVLVGGAMVAKFDPDCMMLLLCAVVTRSGYGWQPGLYWK